MTGAEHPSGPRAARRALSAASRAQASALHRGAGDRGASPEAWYGPARTVKQSGSPDFA
ncbi:hypothetical protein ACFVHB_18020 [Kitasatospora sp. NPDC127111]|uniref:hypothetical protein n=1 Tax=Kitasatospora sp. NPDC127111 TaxID=3345363 RepID=UPI0036408534